MAGAEGWALVAKVLETAVDWADNVADLNAMLKFNRDPIAELGQERPDLFAALKLRTQLRRAHLYATGKIDAPPETAEVPPHSQRPANAIRRAGRKPSVNEPAKE